ncbi:MAG: acriflavin resistance protein [Elusimicrobia bacterium GWB2_63_22]|nr:MAG: acriflavin resistance protein [Elusimicrobia bacterium GWB2_63_22]
MTKYFLSRPHLVFAALIGFSVLGVVGFFSIPRDLFPPADRPQVAVVTVEPGASARYVADHVSAIIERQLYTINGVRRVYSTSNDGFSIVTAEFNYGKPIAEAKTDAANALTKIQNLLPADIQAPSVYEITSYTPPVIVLSLSPRPGSKLDLADLRYMAENYIKPELLKAGNVSNVDVFGGFQKEINIFVDNTKLAGLRLTTQDVAAALKLGNKDMPMGIVINQASQNVFRLLTEAADISQLGDISVTPAVKLKDVAVVAYGIKDPPASLYRGNGKQGIALAIQRPYGGAVLDTINSVNKLVPELKKRFPQLDIQTADSQEELVKLSNSNMIDALRDAIIFTSLVIFIFLADLPLTIIAGLSIPFVYLATIGIMWLLGIGFNIVSLTGIILALGMLVDDAIVILENIKRHHQELGKSAERAAIDGTEEVMLVVFGGTLATAVILLPLLFVGDYPEKIFRPLAGTLMIAVLVSYVVSITFIPIVARKFMSLGGGKGFKFEGRLNAWMEAVLAPLKAFYINLNRYMMERRSLRLAFILPLFMLFAVSLRVILPLEGRDLMPPMDTGIAKVKVALASNTPIWKVNERAAELEKYIYGLGDIRSVSTAIGTEPGVFTVAGGTPYQLLMTVHFVNRFDRKEDIWALEGKIRDFARGLPGVKYADVYDFGAAAFSSIVANVDATLSGPSIKDLDTAGKSVMEAMAATKGLKSYSRSWDTDSLETDFRIDKLKCALYGVTPGGVAGQVAQGLAGVVSSVLTVPNETGLMIKVIEKADLRDRVGKFGSYLVATPKGFIPLAAMGNFVDSTEPTVITRQGMQYTLDVYGYRSTFPITHIMESFEAAMKKFTLPEGVTLKQTGDIDIMMNTTLRMLGAIAMGIVILYLVLVPLFGSWKAPAAIVIAIPLGAIGGAWSLLLADKHVCVPAIMGFVLLGSIIVKNSILLIDFIQAYERDGKDLKTAIYDSITVRTRPILMTAFATSVGMVPIALEWAIGLERLSPLAIVSIGGLILGTFLTLVYVPYFYYLMASGPKAGRAE